VPEGEDFYGCRVGGYPVVEVIVDPGEVNPLYAD
jgi:hypothetical protein